MNQNEAPVSNTASSNKNTERCPIFGVNYCVSNLSEAVHYVLTHIRDLSGQYICFSNVHTTVMAKENPAYRDILNAAALTYPDGAPVAKLQRKRNHKNARRVAGPDFMKLMFQSTSQTSSNNSTPDASARPLKHYFYGSKPETLEALKQHLMARYPNLNICGMYSPPFRALSPYEDLEVIRMINDSGADIVWVGLGAPKQEQWMNAHKNKIKGVMMGVGAGFDFHAGTIQRAPEWIQKLGLEWLYRLSRDPKRLFKRYLTTNSKFVWYLLKDRLSKRQSGKEHRDGYL